MKSNYFFISFILILFPILGIAQTSISGVINDYIDVTSVSASLETVTVSNTAAFSTGQEVLIIQMKGATIDQSQSSSFGSITNYNQAGTHEIMKICAIQGNDITFTKPLIGTYNVNGQVQLVSIPRYNGALISGSDLTVTPWNGVTGGILILKIDGLLDFGLQNVDVSELGFRGAAAVTSGGGCSFVSDASYYTSSTDANAKAEKGEGIVDLISGKECGRGPQANGGGGGNNHNAGGGGGANYGAGGGGGQRIKATSFTCGSVVGVSSQSLVSGYANDKIFLGGGGGAGHGNNTGLVGESGANGGGIVIIIADTIKGNGQKIDANGGANASNSGEGGGGGGAGGTVFLMTDHFMDSLNVEVKGGIGTSTVNVGTSNCNGPGGGGGGGVVLYNGTSLSTLVSVSANGGAPGVIATTSQSNCTVGSNNGAGNGQVGTTLLNWSITDQSEGLKTENMTDTACLSYESPSGKYTWNKTGIYEDTVIQSNGCQKLVVVDLTIDTVDTRVINTGITLEAVATAVSYQWIDCLNNFSPVSGAASKVFNPTSNGSYAVVVTMGECSDTSACYDIEGVGIIEITSESVKVFPNPSNGKVNIEIPIVENQWKVELKDLQGKILHTWNFEESRNESIFISHPNGYYFLEISVGDQRFMRRLLKK